MITIRASDARGKGDRGWLKSRFTFSFADYQDPAFSGFRVLKVMNEDRVAPGEGFGPHAHRDMEIITFVLEGTLRHRDSLSGTHTVGPDEIQTMSAGTGVVHSEVNASEAEPVHLMQIWIEPSAEDLPPGYQQVGISHEQKRGKLAYWPLRPAATATRRPRSIRTRCCMSSISAPVTPCSTRSRLAGMRGYRSCAVRHRSTATCFAKAMARRSATSRCCRWPVPATDAAKCSCSISPERTVAQTIVVVTFYSRGGTTERLATVAAVGAVQMRAGIRMRRVPDPDPAAALAQFPEHREQLRRMHKEYVAPREADLVAADVLVVASPADVPPSIARMAGLRRSVGAAARRRKAASEGGSSHRQRSLGGRVLDRTRAARAVRCDRADGT
jgi:hypothetical protein